ncbi:lanthionine synthetase LanC family protein [Ligilactobacillus faecis]|uniref:class III lanthionine synthetase LanKC N-terminal domain-containing protein n=1 Tax=Ligilactobacillus faecis TaxID=762833 RepID=UPI002469570C|nr:lanthionine synthetase LanC family protein [Ligilactobacillus faecis]WGN90296.1 lanthionine synthetase LanC family protein [Ligilactobacillus faecis]
MELFDYTNYVAENNFFYRKDDNVRLDNLDLFEIRQPLGKDWVVYVDKYWHNVINKKNFSIKQGWKIHITADIDDAQKMLEEISEFLIKKEISFKFVTSKQELWRKNSKQGDKSAVGKFITVYPQNEESFCILLNELKSITDSYKKGTYILNDCCWQESNVFFRYGGFIRNEQIINGKNVLVIEDDEGNYIEDKRTPYYSVPSFISEPNYVKKFNTFPDSKEFEKIKNLNINEVIHFSNSGGVYKFEDRKKSYILKEGRFKSGLDGLGKDGFKRNKNEYRNLLLLKKVPNVIDVYSYFESWRNSYFIEEYFAGETLRKFVASNYPLLIEDDASDYLYLVEIVAKKLFSTLEDIHSNGIGIGDLSINNIMISKEDEDIVIKIIDLENSQLISTKYEHTLVTPGFFAKNISSIVEADWFSYIRIIRYMLLPINFVQDFVKDIVTVQNEIIEEKFGRNVKDILQILDNVQLKKIHSDYKLPYQVEGLSVVQEKIDFQDIGKYISSLELGLNNTMLRNNTLDINGDIPQLHNEWDRYNVSNGLFGALLVINRVSKLNKGALNSKIEVIIENLYTIRDTRLGLLDGVAGVVTALLEMGYCDYAENLLNLYTVDSVRTYKEDISLETGLAGIGLFLLGLYRVNKDTKDYTLCLEIQKLIIDKIKNMSKSDEVDVSLFQGLSGPLLFLVLLRNELHPTDRQDIFLEKLLVMILDQIQFDDTMRSAFILNKEKKYDRIVPYLKNGVIGLGLVLLKIDEQKIFSRSISQRLKDILNHMLKIIRVTFSFDAGLYEGQLGIILFEYCYNHRYNVDSNYTVKLLQNLKLHLLYKNNELHVTGKYGLRCSQDIATGAAGALSVLEGIRRSNWGYWLPILDFEELFKFKDK